MAAVAKSVKAVERMLGQVQAAASWAQSNLAVYQHKHAELGAQVGLGWQLVGEGRALVVHVFGRPPLPGVRLCFKGVCRSRGPPAGSEPSS